jgi:hypothetical protein
LLTYYGIPRDARFNALPGADTNGSIISRFDRVDKRDPNGDVLSGSAAHAIDLCDVDLLAMDTVGMLRPKADRAGKFTDSKLDSMKTVRHSANITSPATVISIIFDKNPCPASALSIADVSSTTVITCEPSDISAALTVSVRAAINAATVASVSEADAVSVRAAIKAATVASVSEADAVSVSAVMNTATVASVSEADAVSVSAVMNAATVASVSEADAVSVSAVMNAATAASVSAADAVSVSVTI